MTDLDKPIGYWLRLLNDRIERRFDADLASQGLGRRHWQVLHLLARNDPQATSVAAIASALDPFWSAEEVSLAEVLGDLSARGWTTLGPADDGSVALTEAGRDGHAQVHQLVEVTRAALMDGLEPHDYVGTVAVLARMAENLAAPSARPDGQPTRR